MQPNKHYKLRCKELRVKNYQKDDEYYTPKYIVDMFGHFDYDPATTTKKANEFNIKNFDTINTNGLCSDWSQYKRIWINPPFTLKKEFLQKACETYDLCKNDIYVLLPIEFLTTKTFHCICKGGILFIPNGLIKFEQVGSDKKSPAFGSIIVKISDHWELKTLKIDKD